MSQPVIYIDANPFIYAIEGEDAVAQPINRLFSALRDRPGMAATSELTLGEVLAKVKSADRRNTYLNLLLWSEIFLIYPISRDVLISTADYRQASATVLPDGRSVMPKLPDAIHVVTAIRSGCKFLLSSDTGIKPPTSIRLINADVAGIAAIMREIA